MKWKRRFGMAKNMKDNEYKDLSVKEFTKAAETYETDDAGIYKMCKDDYPDIIEELEKEPWDTLLDAGLRTLWGMAMWQCGAKRRFGHIVQMPAL